MRFVSGRRDDSSLCAIDILLPSIKRVNNAHSSNAIKTYVILGSINLN